MVPHADGGGTGCRGQAGWRGGGKREGGGGLDERCPPPVSSQPNVTPIFGMALTFPDSLQPLHSPPLLLIQPRF